MALSGSHHPMWLQFLENGKKQSHRGCHGVIQPREADYWKMLLFLKSSDSERFQNVLEIMSPGVYSSV